MLPSLSLYNNLHYYYPPDCIITMSKISSQGGWVGLEKATLTLHFPSFHLPTSFLDQIVKVPSSNQASKSYNYFFPKFLWKCLFPSRRTCRNCPKKSLYVIPGRAKLAQNGFPHHPQKSGCLKASWVNFYEQSAYHTLSLRELWVVLEKTTLYHSDWH